MQEVEVVGEKIWVLGGEGFGTERARLDQGGSSAERARLAQGTNLQNFYLRRIRYFWVQNSKNPDPRWEFFFLGATLQLVENIKPIRQLLCTFSSCSVLDIYVIYSIYKFQEK